MRYRAEPRHLVKVGDMPVQLTRLAEAFRSLGYPVAGRGAYVPTHIVQGRRPGGYVRHRAGRQRSRRCPLQVPGGRDTGFCHGQRRQLLVSDEGIEGVVLKIETTAPPASGEAGEIVCPAGLPVKKLCLFARDQALSGLEFAFGIPGTVGGGVYMNAGAYGGQMADVLTA